MRRCANVSPRVFAACAGGGDVMRALWSGLLVALGLVVPGAVTAQSVKLRATLQVPVTEPFLGASIGQFKAEVEKETANAISIEIFDSGKLYVDDQVVDAVRSGAIEMGLAGLNQIDGYRSEE